MKLWRRSRRGEAHAPGEARAWKDARPVRVVEVWERDGGRCQLCGEACSRDPRDERAGTVDHIVPRSWGGGDELANLRLVCLPCHRARHS